jgi:hypothetical protein
MSNQKLNKNTTTLELKWPLGYHNQMGHLVKLDINNNILG